MNNDVNQPGYKGGKLVVFPRINIYLREDMILFYKKNFVNNLSHDLISRTW